MQRTTTYRRQQARVTITRRSRQVEALAAEAMGWECRHLEVDCRLNMGTDDSSSRKSAAKYREWARQCERQASLTQNLSEKERLGEQVSRCHKIAAKTEKLEAKTQGGQPEKNNSGFFAKQFRTI